MCNILATMKTLGEGCLPKVWLLPNACGRERRRTREKSVLGLGFLEVLAVGLELLALILQLLIQLRDVAVQLRQCFL